MRDTELKRARDRALYEVYVKGLEEGRFSTMREAADYVRKQPAPSYFIESKKASVYIGRILSGVSLIDLNSNSRRKIWALLRLYKQYRKAHPESKLGREMVMEILVDSPAPEFYINAEMSRKILMSELRKRKAKWME